MDWSKVEFKDEKRYLSNMYETPIIFSASADIKESFPEISFDGHTYGSSEHLYQSLKSNSEEWHEKIRSVLDPHKTKTMAKKELTTQPDLFGGGFFMRPDFHSIKSKLMFLIVYLKFSQNEELKEKLLATGDELLIEKNCWHDTYWGVCDGVGKNILGRILMQVRYLLKNNLSPTIDTPPHK